MYKCKRTISKSHKIQLDKKILVFTLVYENYVLAWRETGMTIFLHVSPLFSP